MHRVPLLSFLRVFRQARDAFAYDSADEGFELFRSLSGADEVNISLGRAKRKGSVSERAASVPSALR